MVQLMTLKENGGVYKLTILSRCTHAFEKSNHKWNFKTKLWK